MVGATLALLAWNLLSWLPEVALLRYAQRRSPALARNDRHVGSGSKGAAAAAEAAPAEAGAAAAAEAAPAEAGAAATPSGGDSLSSSGPLRRQARAWALYASQPAAAAATALALVYLTVMSWGGCWQEQAACKWCRCCLRSAAVLSRRIQSRHIPFPTHPSPAGTLMTAYLKALGMPETELAMYRG